MPILRTVRAITGATGITVGALGLVGGTGTLICAKVYKIPSDAKEAVFFEDRIQRGESIAEQERANYQTTMAREGIENDMTQFRSNRNIALYGAGAIVAGVVLGAAGIFAMPKGRT